MGNQGDPILRESRQKIGLLSRHNTFGPSIPPEKRIQPSDLINKPVGYKVLGEMDRSRIIQIVALPEDITAWEQENEQRRLQQEQEKTKYQELRKIQAAYPDRLLETLPADFSNFVNEVIDCRDVSIPDYRIVFPYTGLNRIKIGDQSLAQLVKAAHLFTS